MANEDRIDPNVPGLDSALAFRGDRPLSNVQSGTAYTAQLSDVEKVIRFTGASPATLTIPPNSAQPFPVHTVLTWAQEGAGAVTVAAGSGVTLNKASSQSLAAAGRRAVVQAIKTGTDTWTVFGALAAA